MEIKLLLFSAWTLIITHNLWVKSKFNKSIEKFSPSLFKELGSPTIFSKEYVKAVSEYKPEQRYSKFIWSEEWKNIENEDIKKHGQILKAYKLISLPIFVSFAVAFITLDT